MSKQIFNNQASSPGTPAAGKLNQWSSTTNKRFWYTDENGVSNPIGIPYTTYYVDDYGVTPANSAATNVTNMNTLLQTTAADKSRIQFGSGTYQFNAGLTTLTKDFAFVGTRGMTTIAITAAMGSSTPFLKLSNAGYYTSFRDLVFTTFATQSTNYAIQCQNNVNVEFLDCFFTGGGFNWSGVIDFTGTNSGNGAILKNVYIANFAGIAINVSSPLDTMYIEDLEIIGTGLSGQIGIFCDNGGAMLLSGCQIINCDVNMKLAPADTKTVSAIFAVNCFFDQGKTNCLLITGAGTGTVARCHFVGCWFTIAGTSSSSGAGANTKCIQITTAGTGIHSGIEFDSSWIMNATTGSTGTIEGILATSAQDFSVTGCQLAGWTNGIHITPPTTVAVCSPTIIANTIGAAGLIATNTTGILLDAGAPTTYGQINIQNNTLGGNTTAISDASTIALAGQKIIKDNTGLPVTTKPIIASSAAINTTETYIPTAIALPANGLLAGTTFRLTLAGTCTTTAANVSTFTVRVGTTGTTPASDTTATAALTTPVAATTGTAVPFRAVIEITVRAVGASTLLQCIMSGQNLNVTTTQGIVGTATVSPGFGFGAATGTFNNNTALFLNVSYKSAATTTTSTFTNAFWEVIDQQ